MLQFFQRKRPKGVQVKLKIKGMHCSSCAMTIDNELEEISGVIKSQTSYAKGETDVEYDAVKVLPEALIKKIESLDYSVEKIK